MKLKTLPEFPDYQISDSGRIFHGDLELKCGTDRDGYLTVNLRRNCRQTKARVHRLLLSAFIRPPRRGEVARHLNGDPADNRLENLAWGTQRQNMSDRDVHGTTARGSRNGRAKLKADDVREIRRRVGAGEAMHALAKEYELNPKSVRDIVKRINWAHID